MNIEIRVAKRIEHANIFANIVSKVTVVLYISTDEGKSFESRL